ncbi:taurocyamine kinase-like isoform X2 [Lineus longissimus]|uniref:taurocyamine kinase-like isoform X2 n=1 Tax=Lineus longissimus TaxID=88925 RepID=UPI002B4DC1E7
MVWIAFGRLARYLGAFSPRLDTIQTYFRPRQTRSKSGGMDFKMNQDAMFKTLQNAPADSCRSLVKKYLTPEVYAQVKDRKTKLGGTLAHCINTGIENLDSTIGIMACDPEGYEVFAPLMDNVIKDYHKFPMDQPVKHPACDFGDLNKLPFSDLDPEGRFILSTRVRVGRSVKGIPFPPAIDRKARKLIETKAKAAFSSLEGEYRGKYYSLETMTPADERQLIEDHYLFKNDDRFNEKAGVYRDWCEARGIFHNDAKTFLSWVNEEDHLRIISMQKGGNLGEVYTRLINGINHIGKNIDFVYSDRLGYVTFCPTNLGTTMRSSVHMRIPHCAKDEKALNALCAKHNIQPRGVHGEHSESVGGVYDLSNKRRLGLTEIEAATEMANGILAIIAEERRLCNLEPRQHLNMTQDEMVKKIQAATPEKCNSLVKKYLTPEVYNKIKDKKTELGGTLAHCINTGAVNIDSSIGIMACDPEAYEVFADLLDNVIKDYHKFPMDMPIKHPACNFGDLANLQLGNLDPNGKNIVSTRIRVGRSVKKMPLPPLICNSDREYIEILAKQAFATLPDDLKGTYYSLETMTPEDERQLIADHFLFKNDDRFNEKAGVYRDWAKSRGIFHNPQKNFLVWLNEEDNLRIISMQRGGNVEEVYTRLVKGINHMEKKLEFAHSVRLGYLTFCPTNLGTTMRASVHMRIPHSAENETALNALCAKYNIQPRGIHGEHSESVGGVYDLSNKRRLGLTEFEAVTEMSAGVKAILAQEESLCNLEPRQQFNMTQDEMFKKLQAATPEQCNSLVKKYLTPEVYAKLKDKKTKLGGTLAQCINTGAENIDSSVGMMACDPEAYEVFADLLDNVIKDYHKFPMDMPIKHPACDFGDLNNLPFGDINPVGCDNMIVSTRVRVGRSVAGMPLPPQICKHDRRYIETKAKEGFTNLTGEFAGTYHGLEGMSSEVEKQLIDDHFLFKNDDRFNEQAGVYRDWPEARGIFYNSNKTFLTWVNEEDHLRLISMQPGGNLGEVYKRLVNGIDHMGKVIPFAHSERLGYLTFCATNLGTTMRASVHARIPESAKDENKLKKLCAQHNIQPRGVHGEHSESVGGVYDLSNKRRLGLTEIEAATEMANGIRAILTEELRLQNITKK